MSAGPPHSIDHDLSITAKQQAKLARPPLARLLDLPSASPTCCNTKKKLDANTGYTAETGSSTNLCTVQYICAAAGAQLPPALWLALLHTSKYKKLSSTVERAGSYVSGIEQW